MKKTILFIALALIMGMNSCSKKAEVLTAEQVVADAATLVDQTITVEGQCLGVCMHSHRKAFVAAGEDAVLFVTASDEMAENFSDDCKEQTVRFTGIMRAFTPEPQPEVVAAEEADTTNVAAEEVQADTTAEVCAEDGEEHECCKHEAKAQQAETIYYLEATSYEIVK